MHDIERDIGQYGYDLSSAVIAFGELPDVNNRFTWRFRMNRRF
jgi:hypothetical protein